jgi:two-component system OmpR family response regulator
VRDGAQAGTALANTAYDLLLLDLGLPRRSRLEVLRALRAHDQRLPVLIATARDAVAEREAGLDAGADDYIVKPYDLDELLARVRALLRAHGRAEPAYAWGAVRIVPATREVAARPAGAAVGARMGGAGALLARPAACCRASSWRTSSTPGARKSAATRSRSTSTACAASWAPA